MKLKLTRGSSDKTPFTNQEVVCGGVVEVDEEEGRRMLFKGRYTIVPEESPDVIEGFDNITKTALPEIPTDWTEKNILIIHSGGIGDNLIACSLVPYLKRKICSVSMVCSENAVPFVSLVKGLDNIYSGDKANDISFHNNFDIVLKASNFMKENNVYVAKGCYFQRIHNIFKLQGEIQLPALRNISLSRNLQAFLKHSRHKRFVAVHTQASASHRCWNDSKWSEFFERLDYIGYGVLLLGTESPQFENHPNVLHCSHFSPGEQISLISASSLVVCVDSCFLHIAGILKKQTVALFGPSIEDDTCGQYTSVYALRSRFHCQKCRFLQAKNCTKGFQCMQDIEVENLMEACSFFIGTTPTKHKAPAVPVRKYDLALLKKKTRLLVAFPHLVLGGGETSTMRIAEGLKPYFDIKIIGLDSIPLRKKLGIHKELKERFDDVQILPNSSSSEAYAEADVVLWYGINDSIPMALAGLKENRPVSIRVTHTHYPEEGEDFYRRWEQVIDGVICVSPVIAEKIPGAKFIPNPVPEISETGEKKKLFKTGRTAGFLGRFDGNKNVKWLVENLKKMDCNLVVQGLETEEISKDQLLKIAKAQKVEKRLKILKPSRDVGEFFRSIDVLVIPSKQEGLPMVCLEAGYLGVPVVATKVGALPSLFSEQISFVDSFGGFPDVDQMKDAIATASFSSGILLRKKVRATCLLPMVAEQYRKLIRKKLGEKFPEDFQKKGFASYRYEGAGDVYLSLAFVRKIREMFPEAPYYYTTKEATEDLVRIFAPDLEVGQEPPPGRKSLPIDYDDCWKNFEHIARGMGGEIADLPRLPFSGHDNKVIGIFSRMNKSALRKVKEWPEKNWEELIQKLLKRGYSIRQLGHTSDDLIKGAEDSRTGTFQGLVKAMQQVGYLITIDSLALHLGYGLSIPTLALFGKSSFPWLSSYEEVENVVSAYDCTCYGSIKSSEIPDRCDIGCMEAIPVQDVEARFLRIVKN